MNGQIKPLTGTELIIFKGYLHETYEYFLFNKIGHNGFDKFPGISGEIYYDKKFKYIWDTMLRLSEVGYLSRLANMFDKDIHWDKDVRAHVDNIVFCRIADESILGCQDTLNKIKRVRNKALDHIDSNTHTYQGGKTLSEAFGLDLKGKDVQILFNETFKFLKMEEDQKRIEETMKEKFRDWYAIFEKGYPK